MSPDSLILQWQRHGYDYDQEFAVDRQAPVVPMDHHTGPSHYFDFEWLRWLKDFLLDDHVQLVVTIIFLLLIIAGSIWFYRDKFVHIESKEVSTLTDEDTIYGIDFARELQLHEAKSDLYQCIRLRYLWLLRQLHDHRRIFWQPSKTPDQYRGEVQSADFDEITLLFMQVRYGNYPATPERYERVRILFDALIAKYIDAQ